MPRFGKNSLSLFLRNKCERQFINSLYSKEERKKPEYNFPAKQESRPGLTDVGESGYRWQNKKTDELIEAFGQENIKIRKPVESHKQPGEIELLSILNNTENPPMFIVEALFNSDNHVFRKAIGFDELKDKENKELNISKMRIDVLQILPPVKVNSKDSHILFAEREYNIGVNPDGTLFNLENDDDRSRLRVIDIKQNTDPGHSYFAEVVYYSMALAAFLENEQLNAKFVVIAAPAIWAGGYKDKRLMELTAKYKNKLLNVPLFEALKTLNDSIVIADMDIYAPRLRRLFKEELPELLKKEWDELNWHVDSRCKGCEWIGYSWKKDETVSPDLCLPEAKRKGHLSSVVGLSMGSKKFLGKKGITTIKELGNENVKSNIFDDHQILRSKRNVFPHRAEALQRGQASRIPYASDIALMPRYANLRIFIFLDFDLSTALTSVMGIEAYWSEPLDYNSTVPPHEAKKKNWKFKYNEASDTYEDGRLSFVDAADIKAEEREFINFLKKIKNILDVVFRTDIEDKKSNRRKSKSSYQIYLWDELQYKHLVRLLERHLLAVLNDEQLKELAWLFPPPQLLQSPESATRKSPFTFVSEVVKNQVALPVPHHYTLIEVAKSWKPDNTEIPDINSFYQEPMSDLVPPERIHYYWKKEGNWLNTQKGIEITTKAKLKALAAVTWKLEKELARDLSNYAAPYIPEKKQSGKLIAPLSQLWLEYTKLDSNLSGVEKLRTLTMPPHEKEAKLKSARLKERIKGTEKQKALEILGNVIGENLTINPNLLVYKIREGSRDVNIKPGDINFVLSPEYLPYAKEDKNKGVPKFLDLHINSFLEENECFNGTDFKTWCENKRLTYKKKEKGTILEIGLTDVSIKSIDRNSGYIALEPGKDNNIEGLELHPNIDFSKDVILDHIHKDFLLEKLKLTLEGIGYYQHEDDEKILKTLRTPQKPLRKKESNVPAVNVFWKTKEMAELPTRYETGEIRSKLSPILESANNSLDDSQCDAWEKSLSRQFTIIWGPPGTGKSWTLENIIIGAVLEAKRKERSLRLLITAGTNTAITNVLYSLEEDMRRYGIADSSNIYQVTSKYYQIPKGTFERYPKLKILRADYESVQEKIYIEDLLDELNNPQNISIIGCTPQQLHNLAVFGISWKDRRDTMTIRSWFDFIVLDEASQIDIASTSLIYSKMSEDCICVVAGDNLQLPPIQKASPPEDLEYLVGSAYDFFKSYRKVEHVPLQVNYRSNKTIVELTRAAGYNSELKSKSPDLKLNFSTPLPEDKPNKWNNELFWTRDWADLLNPDKPATCFIYKDDESSQINEFEADSITSLIALLKPRLKNKLLNDNTITDLLPSDNYSPVEFWSKAVGIITPHKVQMSKVIDKLQSAFPDDPPQSIRNAVDTVERFQGQQRDIIFCSFGLGDVDLIGNEDEFLYNLNRFNVIASRARAKFIAFFTRTFLDHLSDNQDVILNSRLIKRFAEQFCNNKKEITLGYIKNNNTILRKGTMRWNE